MKRLASLRFASPITGIPETITVWNDWAMAM
jgi:hypothetical protein